MDDLECKTDRSVTELVGVFSTHAQQAECVDRLKRDFVRARLATLRKPPPTGVSLSELFEQLNKGHYVPRLIGIGQCTTLVEKEE